MLYLQVMGDQLADKCKGFLEDSLWSLWVKETSVTVVSSVMGVLFCGRVLWYCAHPGPHGRAFPVDQ